MKTYKEQWVNGQLVVGEPVEAPQPVKARQVQWLYDAYGIKDSGPVQPARPKIFERRDAKCTEL